MGNFKKRGQITIFIILGILILFGSATYFYIKQKTTTFVPNTVEIRKTTALNPYVEQCLELKAREAFDLIGTTGGYIDYPLGIKNDPASYLKISPFSEERMPYWWYNGERRIPPLTREDNQGFSIQQEVEDYLISHIDECINNFTAIKGYDVTKTGATDVKVTFGEKDISVEMKYPLRAVKIPEQNEFSLNDYDFYVKIPIRFKEIYGLSSQIMEDENSNYFMEKFTMDLVSLDDNGQANSTPLMNMDFSLKPYMWLLPNVQKELQALITQNVQYIKFRGTEYNPIPDTMPYMQNHYIWGFDPASYNSETPIHQGIHTSVVYDQRWKPFSLYVSPTKSTVLKSGQTPIGGVLSFIGWQTWHFTYDIVYPVEITLYDEGSKNSDPYTFSYAFLVSIQKNNPYKQLFGSQVFETDDWPENDEACQYMTDNFDTRITVSTINNMTGHPLNGVNLSFTCGRYTCPIGRTEVKSQSATSELTAKFPHCPWGILRGYKQGYEDAQMFMAADQEKTITFSLKPVVEYQNYTIVKQGFNPKNQIGNQIGQEGALGPGEQAVLLIKSPGMADQYASIPSEAPTTLKFYKDKQLSYNITIYLFSAGSGADDSRLLGAYDAEWSPDPILIANSNFIKFHTLEYATTNDEELGLFLAGIRSYSTKISQPELITR